MPVTSPGMAADDCDGRRAPLIVPTKGQEVAMAMSPVKPASVTRRLDTCADPNGSWGKPTGPHAIEPEMAPSCPVCEYVPPISHSVSIPVPQKRRTPAELTPSAAMFIESCSPPAGMNPSTEGAFGGHGRGSKLRTRPAAYCP